MWNENIMLFVSLLSYWQGFINEYCHLKKFNVFSTLEESCQKFHLLFHSWNYCLCNKFFAAVNKRHMFENLWLDHEEWEARIRTHLTDSIMKLQMKLKSACRKKGGFVKKNVFLVLFLLSFISWVCIKVAYSIQCEKFFNCPWCKTVSFLGWDSSESRISSHSTHQRHLDLCKVTLTYLLCLPTIYQALDCRVSFMYFALINLYCMLSWYSSFSNSCISSITT